MATGSSKLSLDSAACCCLGPQNGEPLCPCRMRGVVKINGKWYQELDLGPTFTPYDPCDVLDTYRPLSTREEPDD